MQPLLISVEAGQILSVIEFNSKWLGLGSVFVTE